MVPYIHTDIHTNTLFLFLFVLVFIVTLVVVCPGHAPVDQSTALRERDHQIEVLWQQLADQNNDLNGIAADRRRPQERMRLAHPPHC